MESSKFRVIIVGGGPIGLYTAHALAAANIDFVVLERQPDIVQYRGALLFLWPSSVRQLHQVGLLARATDAAIRCQGKTVMRLDGQTHMHGPFFSVLEEQHAYPTLGFSRGNVIQMLYESLPKPETQVRTNAQVVNIETDAHGVRVHLQDGTVEEGSMVIGADGVYSKTREVIERESAQADKDTANPMIAKIQGLFGRAPHIEGIEKGHLYETHGSGMASQSMAVGDFLYFTLLRKLPEPTTERKTFSQQETEEMAGAFGSVEIYPKTKFRDIWNQCDRANARLVLQEQGVVDKWYHGRLVLLGDSAHKMTSGAGLGVNVGMNSAIALVNELWGTLQETPHPGTDVLEKAFSRYQSARENECRAVCAGAEGGTQMITRSTWKLWFIDRFMSPWGKMESDVHNFFTPILEKSLVLDFVPFEGKHGRVPWLRESKDKLWTSG